MLFNILRFDYGGTEILLIIIAFLLAITLALSFHEWAHAYAAYRAGDPTAKMMGRMTLNPARHVEPMGMLMFLFIGIGWAKPVPVNPFNYRNFKRGNFWVSISGVGMNFVMGFISSLCLFLTWHYGNIDFVNGLPHAENVGMLGLYFFFWFATSINVMLMVFNLLPIPPLDGYNLLISFTKPNNGYMNWIRQHGQVVLIVVLIVSIFTGGIFILADGIIWSFNALWGAIFGV